ncbi:MAG: hypothetical protein GVY32_05620 [Gammaproteobacteria bacterium]|jgi:uncharacterized membrane protein YecN with MAPEG domain|nr:hypothetical protein [Gammaproteobacteria bacterium]
MAYTATMFYAGLLGLVLLALSARVVRLRRSLKVGIGSGGHEALDRAMRTQANFAEYVPLALLLLLLVESATAASPWVAHVLGSALLVGRVLHGFAGLNLDSGYSFGRFWGTLLTWLTMAATALMLVAIAVGRWVL